MTSSLRKKIARAQGLTEALRMLQEEPAVSGALKIMANTEEATVALSKGRITGAAVSPSGERGKAALEKIAQMDARSMRYVKFHEIIPFGDPLDITLESFLSQITAPREAPQTVLQPVVAGVAGKTEAAEMGESIEVPAEPAADSNGFEEAHHELKVSDGLSNHQLGVLEAAAALSEPDPNFNEEHPQLDETVSYEQLKKRQEELLAQVKQDDKPFDFVEKHVIWDTPSLEPEQRAALQKANLEGKDLKTFEEVNEFLKVEGLGLTRRQEDDLRWIASKRTPREQQDEFHAKDEGFTADNSSPEMKELLQQEQVAATTTEALDAIAAPAVEEQDRVPLRTLSPAPHTPKRQDKPWSIIGRLVQVGDYVGYTKPFRDKWQGYNFLHSNKQFRTGADTFIGVFVLFAMCMGIFVIPAMIKDQDDKESAAKARQRLAQSVHEDLASESPQEDSDMATTKSNPPAVANQGTANHGFAGNFDFSPDTEDLRFGRHLVVKGKIEAAIPYYERYMTLDPEANDARIELINAYIATRQRYKARKLCIKAIKLTDDPKQLAALWQLLSQCQTD